MRHAISALLKLHAELGGKLLDNRKQAARLRGDMRHVEAVIQLLEPGFKLRPLAIRRNKPNPWFKRGTVFRHAIEALKAVGRPLTSREITIAMLAKHGVSNPNPQDVHSLICGINSSLRHNKGRAVFSVGQGFPIHWTVAR
jgi:hypothetical protein